MALYKCSATTTITSVLTDNSGPDETGSDPTDCNWFCNTDVN